MPVFPVLAVLQWLGLPALGWIRVARGDIHPHLKRKPFNLSPLSIMLVVGFLWCSTKLKFCSIPIFLRFFLLWMAVDFLNAFSALISIIVWVFFSLLQWWFYMINMIDFYCWTNLASLVDIVYNSFSILLNSIFKYFVEDFCVCIHKGYWSRVFLFCIVFVWFCYQGNTNFIKMNWEVLYPLLFFGWDCVELVIFL